ncbi:diguanylate cyclase [Dongshaea marina]|uniref:diguanylate cyclase n=1 Tax=Dongshaea marina TaxID=2047966 RepID=UPI000D3E69FA|nr:diguanylate cyclase [Dongshaea marina]
MDDSARQHAEQLQQKLLNEQTQHQQAIARLSSEQKLACHLIGQLMNICRGLDRELDNRLADLKHELDQFQGFESITEQLDTFDKYLLKQAHIQEESFADSDKALHQGRTQLKKIKQLPREFEVTLKELLNTRDPYSMREYQQQTMQLLDFYQNLWGHFHNGDAPSEATFADGKVPEQLTEELSDKLQLLVGNIELSQPLNDQLKELRKKLLAGSDPDSLTEVSLQVMMVLMQGLYEERTAFQELLGAMGNNLTSLQHNFDKSVNESCELHEQGEQADTNLQAHISELQQSTQQATEFEDIKRSVVSGIDTISSMMIQRRHLKAREQVLLNRLNDMGSHLKQVQEEADEYKKQLDIQKSRLYIDKLTQIGNREALEERMKLEFKRWKRYGTPLGVAIADLDFFKSVNDRFGHIAGDKVLKVVARTLQLSLRDTDFVARFGGEEFILLLPNIPADQLFTPLEKIREAVNNIPFHFKDENISVTISIGATLLLEGDTSTTVFERADTALYQAKNEGRNRVILSI